MQAQKNTRLTHATSDPSMVRLASGPRAVLMRPGVGAAGHIVQRSDLTTHRVVVEQATLILVEEGRKRIRWSGGECAARSGEALSLQAGEVVDISNAPGRSGEYRALWICWSSELVAAAASGAARRRLSPPVAHHSGLGEAFRDAYYRAFDGLSDAEPERPRSARDRRSAEQPANRVPASIATHRLQEVLLWLSERGFHFRAPGPVTLRQQVRRLLATDPAADWSMTAVARALATSVPTLRRHLAAEGGAFRDLVHDVRMSHALTLLQNTDTPVLQVAMATGYASASRFSARFRARFGYQPTAIRGQQRERTAS